MIGVIALNYPRGLGAVARTLRWAIEASGRQASLFPQRNLTAIMEGKLHVRAEGCYPGWGDGWAAEPGTRLAEWMEGCELLIVPEILPHRVLDFLQILGRPCIAVPMSEAMTTTPEEIPSYGRFAAIVSPNRMNRDLCAMLRIPDAICHLIPWALEREPAMAPPLEGPPRLWLSGGWGGSYGRRMVPEQIAGFVKALPNLPPGTRLAVHLQAPLPDLPEHEAVDMAIGTLPDAEYAALRGNPAFSLVVSAWEGLGYPILESLYAGIPVLSCDAPPMSEMVAPGFNGWTVPPVPNTRPLPLLPGSPQGLNWVRAARPTVEAIAAGIEKLCEPDLLAACRAHASDGCAQKRRTFLRLWADLFDKLCGKMEAA